MPKNAIPTRTIFIERESDKYQRVHDGHETTGYPMDDEALANIPGEIFILTGNRLNGDGQSNYGFVMQGSDVLGYVNLSTRHAMGAMYLEVKGVIKKR
jgi:hypothetical protein